MKESRDTDRKQLSDQQIAEVVRLSATLNVSYITVDTHWDYPDYMQRWVSAIRAVGKHVWFRILPNQWEDDNGAVGVMTPADFEASEGAFLAANSALFQSGDILDPCAEPENGIYWQAQYGTNWTANGPNLATSEYNAFIRDTSDIADAALHDRSVYGVLTNIRSINAYVATHPSVLERATVSKLGMITVDSYPEGSTVDPATAANARVSQLAQIEQLWNVPVVIGEMGFSDRNQVDDATQAAVLTAEFQALAAIPYIRAINYWVGTGTNQTGGFTQLFDGTQGTWATRPAANVVAAFFAAHDAQADATATATASDAPATATASPTGSSSRTPTYHAHRPKCRRTAPCPSMSAGA